MQTQVLFFLPCFSGGDNNSCAIQSVVIKPIHSHQGAVRKPLAAQTLWFCRLQNIFLMNYQLHRETEEMSQTPHLSSQSLFWHQKISSVCCSHLLPFSWVCFTLSLVDNLVNIKVCLSSTKWLTQNGNISEFTQLVYLQDSNGLVGSFTKLKNWFIWEWGFLTDINYISMTVCGWRAVYFLTLLI